MTNEVSNYLNIIDKVNKDGNYKDSWESLKSHQIPEWYKNAKFGIFIHFGVYSVPAYNNEWYPRDMYIQGTDVYEHHLRTYGPHKDFGYTDFIPMFKAENFNADEWAKLFKDAGAKYVMPVAEHHDGIQMYDSNLSNWNTVKMGPQIDFLAEIKSAVEKEDIVFCTSSHRAENYWYFGGARHFDSGIRDIVYQEPYGYAHPAYTDQETMLMLSNDIHSINASEEHLQDWLARTCELVDKYRPKAIYFDWWIQNVSFKPYLKKFAAYYYNRAESWGSEVAINYKFDAFALSTAVFDVERGQLNNIRPSLWQTDSSLAKNTWGYTEENDYKNANDIICDLIDIVSKNGCLLLNIGPKPDGTIPHEEQDILRSIGKWLSINGESIYNTTCWKVYGEGPTEVKEGSFTDTNRPSYTSEDIRFTYNAPYLYCNVLSWPENNVINIKSLSYKHFNGELVKIEILGYDLPLTYTRNETALDIKVNQTIVTKTPVCIKIEID